MEASCIWVTTIIPNFMSMIVVGIAGIVRIVFVTYLDAIDSEYWDNFFIAKREKTLLRSKRGALTFII